LAIMMLDSFLPCVLSFCSTALSGVSGSAVVAFVAVISAVVRAMYIARVKNVYRARNLSHEAVINAGIYVVKCCSPQVVLAVSINGCSE
jgi:hypothetical protein